MLTLHIGDDGAFDPRVLLFVQDDFHTSKNISDLKIMYEGIHLYVSMMNDWFCEKIDSALSKLEEFERNWIVEINSNTSYGIKGVPQREAVLLVCAFSYRKGMLLARFPDKRDDAYEAFKKHFSYQVKVYANTKITESRSVYSFRPPSEYCISDLLNNTITAASPHVMNDPFDTLLFEWIDSQVERDNITSQLYSQAAKYIRIRSFVTPRAKRCLPIQNTLMWAHYAASHYGICIKYSLSPAMQEKREMKGYRLLKEVIYPRGRDHRIVVKSNSIDGETALLYKCRDWSYEHEVRLLTYYTDSESDYYPISLDPMSYVEAIYFGLRCNEQLKKAIMKIFENDSRITFYQMRKRPENIYSLRAEKILR